MTRRLLEVSALIFLVALYSAGCSGTGVEETSTPGRGTSENTTPFADAGTLQNVSRGSLVTLDGSGSADADGDLLTYRWSFLSKPEGSSATLSNQTVVMPTFTPDVVGEYVAQVVVDDERGGSNTAQVTVAVGTGNIRPIAHAGKTQRVSFRPNEAGAPVLLDGSKSKDANGDALAYEWTLQSPNGSLAELSDRTAEKPTFTADKAGDYDITLAVKDKTLTSLPAKVKVIASIINVPPVANAGNDLTVSPGATVTLSGVGTDGNPEDAGKLTYKWKFVTPVNAPALSNDTSPTVTFQTVPFSETEAGRIDEYVVGLTVSDGRLTSEQDNIIIKATPAPNAGPDQAVVAGINESVPLASTVANATEYTWSLDPANSAILSTTAGTLPSQDQTSVSTNFSAPNPGSYKVTLEAIKKINGVILGTDKSEITITADTRPVANAGQNFTAKVCSSVQLTGNPNGMSSYTWAFTVPLGGTAVPSKNEQNPSFKPDQSGSIYRADLTVNNGQLNSLPHGVDITVQDQGLGQQVYDTGPQLDNSAPVCTSCHSAGSHDKQLNTPDLKVFIQGGLTAEQLVSVLITGTKRNGAPHPGGRATTNNASCHLKQLWSFVNGLQP